jgi:orotidine-5'-phosphate decarboxylase
VIVALDFPDVAAALALFSRLHPDQCRLKVGFELFTVAGPALVEQLVAKGFDVFLDLKFHDIPNTVASACAAAARLGVWMLNVHALGGRRMLTAAREAVEKSPRRPVLIGVTVLTSHSRDDLEDIGLAVTPGEQVLRLAALVKDSGLDGVVCSAQEATRLRTEHGPGFCLVTPGIRPAGSARGDQERIVTPVEALRAGSDYLVIGRPVTQAADPLAVLAAINQELAGLQR